MLIIIYHHYRIIAVNYEARNFGVTRGMRGDEAKKMCPDLVLVHVPEVRGKADLSK
jgi:DNA polymerase eta